jgi:hypothetical protein
MCLLIGYRFALIPRILITERQAYKRLKKCLFNLNVELEYCGQSYVNGKETLLASETAVEKVQNFQRSEFLPNLEWRMEEIKKLQGDNALQTVIENYKKYSEEDYMNLKRMERQGNY